MPESKQERDVKTHKNLFIVVFLLLCLLTAMSFWISRSHLMNDLVMGWTAMLAVSFAKALLVIMFFMHLWWERNWKYVLTIPSMIMAVLLVLLLVPDVGYRTEHYSQDRENAAAKKRELRTSRIEH